MSISILVDQCKSLGKTKPNLEGEDLSKHLAKLIVTGKILDDDAFEVGIRAYNKGKEEVS